MGDDAVVSNPATAGIHGRTWWGSMWLSAITADTPRYAKEVMQGEALFRRGAVTDLQVAPGAVRARVTDRDTTTVTLNVDVLPVANWDTVARVVAEQLRFTAALLRRQFPAGLHQRLSDNGVDLFADAEQLTLVSESLGAGVNRHTIAVHRALGLRMDRDPNVLFRLRGRDIDQLLAAVAAQRGDVTPSAPADDLTEPEKIQLLQQLVLHPRHTENPSWLFDTLADPPQFAPFERLVAIAERAATTAWRIAAGDGTDVADTELLLAELRARRISTAAVLAEATGQDETAVASQLDMLFDAGVVLRTGTPPNVKYRVAQS